jgi:ribonuclease HI/exonuclease III
MNRSVKTARSFIHLDMNKPFRMIQLNVRKQSEVHDSLMNDEEIQDATVVVVQEPHARKIQGRLLTTPMQHHKWTKMVPSSCREARWPIRSMLWVNKEVEAEQVHIDSPDMTAAVIRLRERQVLVVSVYVPGRDPQALRDSCNNLREAVHKVRRNAGTVVDVVIAGDFNRHDQLWGGEDVAMERQGEADPIIDLMTELALNSLLKRGTKTWHGGDYETTIDLVLASEELTDTILKCTAHKTEHGSDHRMIETVFDITVSIPKQQERLLLKNAPWKEINARITRTLCNSPTDGTVQQKTDRLMAAVLEAVHALTPKARPSPYTKRWWTTDLTQLRRIYTYWRNRARAERRTGQPRTELQDMAKGAAKQYHDAIRQQKRKHWDEFLADNDNIWKAARYLKSGNEAAFGKVPQLVRADGTITADYKEQAEELLTQFFPPLPSSIDDEGSRPQRAPITMPAITMEEVERQLFATKSWKAPGEDGLPAIVWKQIWPVVKHQVLTIFRESVESGKLPSQWRHAKIIPLKKPNKENYTIAKAWRPISLLATLGKVLESVVAERISHVVETYGLLPTNHFGARKQRSAEQALVLLQEQIYTAWRGRRTVSLVSFDVKGAYNGVCKERLLQRMKARGIPVGLLRWIEAFCSERTATIQINGQASEMRSLPQAGLPQGSPLSPILFLFFNADLVQRRINSHGGAIAFVDDFTAWVTGPTAQSNREGIEVIINDALDWEKRSGATFEADKTAIIHFTRKAYKSDTEPFTIKGQSVQPKDYVKILGVTMDAKLRYKEHIARAASKGLKSVMELRRLRGLSPSTARQLFTSTVAPTIDYASSVWMHAFKDRLIGPINRVQRIGAQAIVGTFLTVATSVAEAEAHIASAQDRFWRRAIKLWTDIHTLPETNPLRRNTSRMRKFRKQYRSPMFQVAEALKDITMEELETINPCTLLPWEKRVQTSVDKSASEHHEASCAVRITVSSSARNGVVAMGGAIEIHKSTRSDPSDRRSSFASVLGTREEQNPYSGELAAIIHALSTLPKLRCRNITLMTRNKAVVLTLRKPRQQSGQEYIKRIYESIRALKRDGNTITIIWLPPGEENELMKLAKEKAKAATRQGSIPQDKVPRMRSTTLGIARGKQGTTRGLPEKVGKYSKRIDKALPGKHTRQLYDPLPWKEARVLAQLRTGMARLNIYLHRIKATPTDQCECGQARETVEHFLFRCIRWTAHRTEMLQCTDTNRGNISFYLGGKTSTDNEKWTPNIDAVRATIRFAIATGRLEPNQPQINQDT